MQNQPTPSLTSNLETLLNPYCIPIEIEKPKLSSNNNNHSNQSKYGFSTKAIHAGQSIDPIHGSINTPIYLSSTFAHKEPGVLYSSFIYSRLGNPTRSVFDECMAALEHGKYGMSFSSGLSALTCVFLCLKKGDHIICCDDVYGGTQEYLREIVEKGWDIKVDFVDLTDFESLDKAKKKETKLLIIETPTNPTMKICDIEKLCDWAKKEKILSMVDNTFASPYLQSPLLLGADICMNSCTKYIGGHCDILMGTLTFNDDLLNERLHFSQKSFGGTPSPFESFLALRGLKTLKLRMEEHCKNAKILAEFLSRHPKIERVCYPGLETHPNHEVAKKQMSGFGGMISIYLKGDLETSKAFCKGLKLFTLAVSLGGVESLVEVPALMTHGVVSAEIRKKLKIEDNLIRISVGIENAEDLIKDLENALNSIEDKSE